MFLFGFPEFCCVSNLFFFDYSLYVSARRVVFLSNVLFSFTNDTNYSSFQYYFQYSIQFYILSTHHPLLFSAVCFIVFFHLTHSLCVLEKTSHSIFIHFWGMVLWWFRVLWRGYFTCGFFYPPFIAFCYMGCSHSFQYNDLVLGGFFWSFPYSSMSKVYQRFQRLFLLLS